MYRFLHQLWLDSHQSYVDFANNKDLWQLTARAAISVMIAGFLAMWLQTDQPYWAGMTAFITTEATVGSTLNKCLERITGTYIGAATGLVMIVLFISHPPIYLLSLFLVGAIGIYVAAIRQTHLYAWLLGYLTAFMVMLGSLADPTPHNLIVVAFFRSLEVTIGIVTSTLVGLVLFPKRAQTLFNQVLSDSLSDILELLTLSETLFEKHDDDALAEFQTVRDRLVKNRSRLEKLVDHASHESRFSPSKRRANQTLINANDLLETLVATFRQTFSVSTSAKFSGRDAEAIKQLCQLWRQSVQRYQLQLEQQQTLCADPELQHNIDLAYQRIFKICLEKAEGSSAIRWLTISKNLQLICIQIQQFPVIKPEGKPAHHHLNYAEKIKRLFRNLQDDSYLIAYAATSAVAVLFTPMLWLYFNLPGYSQVAVSIGVVVGLQPDATSFKGFLRFIGCFAGAALAVLLLGFNIDNFALLLLSQAAVTVICCPLHFANSKSSYAAGQAVYVFIVGTINSLYPTESLAPTIERLGGILLGALAIVAFQWLFWRYEPRKDLRHRLLQIVRHTQPLCEDALASVYAASKDELPSPHKAMGALRRAGGNLTTMNPDGLSDEEQRLKQAIYDEGLLFYHNYYGYILLQQELLHETAQSQEDKLAIQSFQHMAMLQEDCRSILNNTTQSSSANNDLTLGFIRDVRRYLTTTTWQLTQQNRLHQSVMQHNMLTHLYRMTQSYEELRALGCIDIKRHEPLSADL
ncbi:p-hydroxybenzoic acid efflux pump subunit AaeB [BD1-7 clade bacterium]|uniref:p-hydroxybenzoic acid efflux pump subunit AaeB n=1 Tax=BD1-7 clade bacterium TaxID=2029982 RepID=A0A5S9QYD2_9GAMM|nr:p-hydroxybenzoic acid efflux pump subunit AaeB [BD1-7 clade bacterium]